MNRATKIIELPALTVDLLKANGVLIDNVFASLWRDIGMKTVLNRASSLDGVQRNPGIRDFYVPYTALLHTGYVLLKRFD